MTEGCDDDHQQQLSLWLDGQLNAEQVPMLVRHLTECPDCRRVYSAWLQLGALFDEAGMLAPKPGFTARFQARLAARGLAPPRLTDSPGT